MREAATFSWRFETLLSSSCALTLKYLNLIQEKTEQSLCYRPIELPVSVDGVGSSVLESPGMFVTNAPVQTNSVRISMDDSLEFAFLAISPENFKSKGVCMCAREVMGCLDVMQSSNACSLDETH